MRKTFVWVGLLVSSCIAIPAYSQVGQDLKGAGQDTKDAAKTGATKSTHAVKKGATKSTHATKKGIHKTATKVSDKTQDTAPHQ